MNNKNYKEYLKNRKWSDATIPQGIDIIANVLGIDLNDGTCTIEETNFYEDTKLSADLKITLNGYSYMVGYRSRKSKFINEYPLDVTLRHTNKAGHKTEYAKVMGGRGDFNLYTFTDNNKIVRWVFINLHALRGVHEYNETKQQWFPHSFVKYQMCSNVDVNDTDFIAYNMLSFKQHEQNMDGVEQVIISHSPGYFEDIKITKLPADGGKFIEMYQIKKKLERVDGY